MCIFFAIIDEACEGPLAEVIGLVNVSPAFVKIEIAWLVVFSAFQRTCFTMNSAGLFESPSMPERHRLRFVRVWWMGHMERVKVCDGKADGV